ncbi:Cof-type HAD-IIB family hydrolase [Zobellella maritima]|uniref:Cof-type HAD-IIB family hydrolase n=1 Tax=Zobellella maritima TaxID=2059725 RepID=UPI000E30AFAE|nr:Cof-type HAD-IIB family hydrolase [Zobellella maritima]
MYQVVVSDLDGTLLNSRHLVSAQTRETLHALVARDVEFIVATGRHHVDVRSIRDSLGLNVSLITSNGAMVHDPDDQLLFNRTIPAEMVDELVADYRLPGVHLNMFRGDHWLVEEAMPGALDFSPQSRFRYRLTDQLRTHRQGVEKVFYIGEHERLLQVEEGLLARFGARLNITFSLPQCLEVMHGEVNKGSAIASLMERREMDMTRVLAFGDGMNDFEMLSRAGRGVIMANAHTRLHQALPHHERTLSSDEDGVAHYLQRVFGL